MKNLLYDPQVLERLDLGQIQKLMKQEVSPLSPESKYKLRPLSISDYGSGYLKLLSQLTHVGEVSEKDFIETFNKMKSLKGTYYVTVIEDTSVGEVIATGTLFIEQKFIHSCALRGRIEDLVVSDKYRGRQLGKVMVNTLKLLAVELGCYKLTLDCRDEMRPFYESLGFKKEETNSNFMQIRYKH